MKIINRFLFLCFLAVLVACSEDAFVPQSEGIPTTNSEFVDLISMTVPDIEMADATTRSILYEDGDEMKFAWDVDDAIGVVPMVGSPLHFPIHVENIQNNTALFDGGQWALRTDAKYAAFFPYNKKIADKNVTSIPIDYTGQTQANWKKYDFLATGAVQPKDGAVKFSMKRLSAILKIKVFITPQVHFQYGTLIAPEPLFAVQGTLDLSGSEPVYTSNVGMSKFIKTEMLTEKVSIGDYYTFYLMIPPTDLSGQTLTFRLTSDSGTAKQATFTGQNFEAGKAYLINAGTVLDAMITNANLIEAAGLSSVAGSDGVNVTENLDKILQVKSINVSNLGDPTVCDEIGFFRNLEYLNCSLNSITSLDVSNNPMLKSLACDDNQFSSLDVSKNLDLESLSCGNSHLVSLDLSKNQKLKSLYCDGNIISSLDLSNCPLLQGLTCSYNSLSSLNVSNNPNLNRLNCDYNELMTLDLSSCVSLSMLNCEENHLYSLYLPNSSSLTRLVCTYNKLSSLNLSSFSSLNYLDCAGNQLTSLDVSNNLVLTQLYCYSNKLTSLDVSKNRSLEKLWCYSNKLTSLNVSGCPALIQLFCPDNKLTSLDVSSNAALDVLYCYNNQLTSLEVTDKTELRLLYCEDNQLTSLVVSNNAALTELRCYNNRLTSLDVSDNKNLEKIDCSFNLLTTFTVNTGVGGLNKLEELWITNCPNLETLSCSNRDNKGQLKELYLNGNNNLSEINCMGNLLMSLNIGFCTNLTTLYCCSNLMRELNIRNNTKLVLDNLVCGRQWQDSDKLTQRTLKLYITSSNLGSGELKPLLNYNSGVEIIEN